MHSPGFSVDEVVLVETQVDISGSFRTMFDSHSITDTLWNEDQALMPVKSFSPPLVTYESCVQD